MAEIRTLTKPHKEEEDFPKAEKKPDSKLLQDGKVPVRNDYSVRKKGPGPLKLYSSFTLRLKGECDLVCFGYCDHAQSVSGGKSLIGKKKRAQTNPEKSGHRSVKV